MKIYKLYLYDKLVVESEDYNDVVRFMYKYGVNFRDDKDKLKLETVCYDILK